MPGRLRRLPPNGSLRGLRPGVPSFLYLLDDLGDEGRQVLRAAARDDAVVGHDLLVDPLPAGVFQVLADRFVRRDITAAHGVGLNQEPRPMADGGDDFAAVEE